MRVDVVFGAAQLTPTLMAGRVVAMIDVLRASTTICVALQSGARAVIPLESADEVLTRSKGFDRKEVRLAGERKTLKIPGFDFGNSPREYTREAVEGRTVIITTTNGTAALAAVQGARDVVVASYVNLTAVSALLRTALRGGTDVTIVCAGRDRQFSLEDAACAGRYARLIGKRLNSVELNDAARSAMLIDRRYGDRLTTLFTDADHGKILIEAGFSADLEICAEVDSYPVIPIYHDRQITMLGPERER